jgi:Mrp family chromosome partitioning ATPase
MLQQLLTKLAEEVDLVLLDSPPILAVSDTAVMAPMVDGVLLVAAKDQATGRRVQRALQQLAKVGAKTLGIVFNRASTSDGEYYYAYEAGNLGSARLALGSLLENLRERVSTLRTVRKRSTERAKERSPEGQ